jgi:hypothetical protein
LWVNRVGLTSSDDFRSTPNQQTFSARVGVSQKVPVSDSSYQLAPSVVAIQMPAKTRYQLYFGVNRKRGIWAGKGWDFFAMVVDGEKPNGCAPSNRSWGLP